MERPHLPQGRPDNAKAADRAPAALAESIVHSERNTLIAGANSVALKWGIDRPGEAVMADRTLRSTPTTGKTEIAQRR